MRKIKLAIILMMIPLLTGCWDERLLKDTRTVYLTGFDKEENETFLTTSIIRDMNIAESSRGEISVSDELVMGVGNSIRESSLAIDRSVAGKYDPAKGRVIILGHKVAEGDILDVLDPIYREPRVDFNAKFAIADQSANKIITHLVEEEVQKGEYLYEMIDTGEWNNEIQDITLRSARTYLFDEGKDFTAPVFSLDEDINKVKIIGSALFHDRRFTGEILTPDESKLLLLFMDLKSKSSVLTKNLDEEENVFISFDVQKVSKKKNIEKQENVHVDIALELVVNVVDYPPNHLEKQQTIDYLNHRLSKILTEHAKDLFQKLYVNQSDVLGFGREIIAFHPSIWEEIKGDDYYKHIHVSPKITVKVKTSGIVS